jgi:hypothetical protein
MIDKIKKNGIYRAFKKKLIISYFLRLVRTSHSITNVIKSVANTKSMLFFDEKMFFLTYKQLIQD